MSGASRTSGRSSSPLRIFPCSENAAFAYMPPNQHFLTLGPYNHSHPHHLEEVVRNKALAAKQKNVEDAKTALERECIAAKECYEGASSGAHNFPADGLFEEIMVRDGCFVLEFMSLATEAEPVGTIAYDFAAYNYPITETLLRQILVDMLCLKNQIPMNVVKKLHRFLGYETQLDDMLDVFLGKYFINDDKNAAVAPMRITFDGAHHLLDAARMRMLPGTFITAENDHNSPSTGLLRDCRDYRGMSVWYSALDLSDGGIKIRSAHHGGKASFAVQDGRGKTLSLPPLLINRDSGFIYSNMVAFEERLIEDLYGVHRPDKPVSSYLRLLNDLLRTPADVRFLTSKGVIVNCLGADEDVVQFFKDLHLQNTYGADMLSSIRKQINDHLISGRVSCMADLRRNYFRSKWAICSVIAAIVLLILIIMQVIYAMLAYHRPPATR